MNNMNDIIAKLRKDAGLTQEQLANMIGVSAQTVSKWETGHNNAGHYVVADYCRCI